MTTVSKALNNYPDVSAETRARIKKVAIDMGYRPNPIASSLVRRESNIIGYVMSSLQSHPNTSILGEYLSGVFTSFTKTDYEVMFLPVDTQIQRRKSYARFVSDYHLAGTILQGLRMDDRYFVEAKQSSTPCVLIDIASESPGIGSVMIDNRAASREAVSYLVKRGHRRIAHVAGLATAWVTQARLAGYRDALEVAGLAFDPNLVVYGDFLEQRAFETARALLRHRQDVTAIFCASDLMAMGVMRAARDLGLAMPDDLALFGFDNVEWAGYVSPPLSTVDQDFHALGYEAARLLHRIVSGRSEGGVQLIPYRTILRESAG